MSDNSGGDSNNNSSNDTTASADSKQDALAANKNRSVDGEHYQAANSAKKSGNHETKRRENAGIKDTSSTDLGTTDKKSADKNPSGGNEIPSADEVSIPSSVDPDAPANTEGDNTDGPNSSESTE